jgi:hypothetical protein
MHRFGRKHVLVLGFSSGISLLCAATPPIGVAVSQGSILVDSMQTPGNATIYDGNTLQTGAAVSQVHLNDGARVRFGSDSRGRIFSDHVDLQQGSAQVSGYAAVARGLSIRPEGTGSASVSIHGKTVDVAALTGNVHVFNAEGINVANLMPGRALNLAPQDAGASAPSSLTGCAVRTNNNIFLTDENTSVTVQLRGGNVPNRRRITVTGAVASNATATSPATQVVNVTSVKEIGGPCRAVAGMAGAAGAGAGAGAAGAAGAGAAGAGAAGAGAAVGVTSAVVAGVAAAAVAATAIGVTVNNSNTCVSACSSSNP